MNIGQTPETVPTKRKLHIHTQNFGVHTNKTFFINISVAHDHIFDPLYGEHIIVYV